MINPIKTTRMFRYFVACLILTFYSCTPARKAPSKHAAPKQGTPNVPFDVQRSNSKEPLMSDKPNKSTEHPPLHHQKVALKNVQNEPKAPVVESVTYSNPALDQWTDYFEKDPKWKAIYQETVTHYLIGVRNNLQRDSSLTIPKSMLTFIYGKKINDTFPLSPEFVEFAKHKFEYSSELQQFIQANPTQLIED
ncbi:MAG: hypothetical protein ACKO4Y_06855 [Flavobacteriales bacterium]